MDAWVPSGGRPALRAGGPARPGWPRTMRAAEGSVITTSAPPPARGRAFNVPPCASTMRRAVARPRPAPRALVVKNGSKIFGSTSGLIPRPRSATTTRLSLCPLAISTSISPRRTIASAALSSTFTNTRCICPRSSATVGSSPVTGIATPVSLGSRRMSTAASSTTERSEHGTSAGSSWREKARRSCTMRFSDPMRSCTVGDVQPGEDDSRHASVRAPDRCVIPCHQTLSARTADDRAAETAALLAPCHGALEAIAHAAPGRFGHEGAEPVQPENVAFVPAEQLAAGPVDLRHVSSVIQGEQHGLRHLEAIVQLARQEHRPTASGTRAHGVTPLAPDPLATGTGGIIP